MAAGPAPFDDHHAGPDSCRDERRLAAVRRAAMHDAGHTPAPERLRRRISDLFAAWRVEGDRRERPSAAVDDAPAA